MKHYNSAVVPLRMYVCVCLYMYVPGKLKLDGTAAQRLDQLDKRETQLLEELSKSKQQCRKLKEDRAQYRKKIEEKE